jgi:K+:H+ antiporter
VAEHAIPVFLVALATLLATARALGGLARLMGLPALLGELAAGALLGDTVLARAVPRAQAWLFPEDGAQASTLSGFAAVAVVVLIGVAGLELDVAVVRRRFGGAWLATLLGILVPCAAGFAMGMALPAEYATGSRTVFAAYLGVILSISALPVVAKALFDLGLYKSDVGLYVMTAAMASELFAWLALTALEPASAGAGPAGFGLVLAIAALFGAFVLVVGRAGFARLLSDLDRPAPPQTGRILGLLFLFVLVGASAASLFGAPYLYGAFVVGIGFGATRRLSERTRFVVQNFAMKVFAPIFFAWVGLHIDLVRAFDLRLCLVVLGVATAAKVGAGTLGARGAGVKWREATAVGVGLNARGTTAIVITYLAFAARVIDARMLVALIAASALTSITSGPLMKRILYRDDPEEDVVALLRRGAFVSELHASSPNEAITELVRSLGSLLTGIKRDARDRVLERELVAATGLGDEVAIPHAAIEGLDRPLLALGRAPHGIDFDAPDGKPARIVFLLLIPAKAFEEEVRILASIARSTYDEAARRDLMAADGLEEVTRVLAVSARRVKESMRPPAAGFAGM